MILIIKTFFGKFQMIILLLNILLGLIPVGSIAFFSKIVSSITEKTDFSDFLFYGLALMLCIILGPIVTDLIKIYSLKFEAQTTKLCTTSMDKYYQGKDYLSLQSSSFQNKLMIVQSTDQIIVDVFDTVFMGVRSLVTLVGSLGLMIIFPKTIIFLVIFLGVISLMINRYIGSLQFKQQMELIESGRINQKKANEILNVKNHPSTYFYDIIHQLKYFWGKQYDNITDKKIKQISKITKVNILAEIVQGGGFLVICTIIWFSGAITASSVIIILQGTANLQSSISQLGDAYTKLRDLIMKIFYVKDYLTLLLDEKKISLESGQDLTPTIVRPSSLHSNFSINQMIFSFPDSNQNIVDITSPISFSSGEITLIKGGNGAGKSTFMNCILGMYHVENLEISFDGKKVFDSLNLKKIMRSESAIMFQHNLQLMGSVKFNLHKFNNEFINEKYEINKYAASLYDLHKDRVLDLEVENGVGLSGGQWQCIYLARIFKDEKKIFILDEPSNHLDEYKVDMLIRDLRKLRRENKIVILISHDPRLEEISDTTLFINDGCIKEITRSQETVV